MIDMTTLRKWTWALPLLTGAVTMVGLVAALIGDGVWDVLSAVALALPSAVTLWLLARLRLF